MTDNIGFTIRGLNEYIKWQTEDKRTLMKINKLINDIARNGNTGIGHPEPLKGNLAGYWSREIDEKNRLVYRIFDDERVEIYQCKGHYSDK
ncbi:MAG: Txe/YoeB family addiction module toxin [Synergistaceae bacterium]|nr:Txe/YoeB family addiction module toxin [Synergistaceae bacterium]